MGGKRLNFPKRKKFVAGNEIIDAEGEKKITAEEHEARLKTLREMGILK
jgi:hypothetical protein